MITIHIEPGAKYTWQEFVKAKGPYSIALDGIVLAPTTRIPSVPIANLDHHVDCDRISTRSTSEQAAMEINLGLMKTFQKDGIPTAQLYVNDIDEDVCLSTWLLKNHELVQNHGNPMINRLVYCQDKLDCTAGMYPFGNTTFRRQLAWIMAPYQNARYGGQLHSMSDKDMEAVLEAVHSRITSYVMGEGKEVALEGQFEVLYSGNGWSIVEESGPAARMAMLDSGIEAFVVSRFKEEIDGEDRYHYSIGRRSVWVPFDVLNILDVLSKADRKEWGGSNTIGGSPRDGGSKLSPEEIFEIVEANI